MLGIGGSVTMCPNNKQCWEWARVYMNYCLCDFRDGASFSLGMLSVVSWSLAEVPQIMTSYKTKSAEGMSLAFLFTWVLGDFFNLLGCLLEPATLPTQFYMAVLYTVTTLVLTFQTVYYGHIYHKLRARKFGMTIKEKHGSLPFHGHNSKKEQADSFNHNSKAGGKDKLFLVQNDKGQSSPIPVAASTAIGNESPGKDRYYISARSLASSPTPMAGSYTYQRGYGKRASSLDRSNMEEPLLDSIITTPSSPPNTKNILCVAFVITFFICGFGFQTSASDMSNASPTVVGTVIRIGRKPLQNRNEPPVKPVRKNPTEPPGWLGSPVLMSTPRCITKHMDLKLHGSNGSSSFGNYLGWAMAVIYMGGRLPQICLNIKRGTVEGLSPLMFLFALLGNSTYVASILVSSTEWSKIKPNMPWLVDAAACVMLDSFIILQFIYYSRPRPKTHNDNDHYLKV